MERPVLKKCRKTKCQVRNQSVIEGNSLGILSFQDTLQPALSIFGTTIEETATPAIVVTTALLMRSMRIKKYKLYHDGPHARAWLLSGCCSGRCSASSSDTLAECTHGLRMCVFLPRADHSGCFRDMVHKKDDNDNDASQCPDDHSWTGVRRRHSLILALRDPRMHSAEMHLHLSIPLHSVCLYDTPFFHSRRHFRSCFATTKTTRNRSLTVSDGNARNFEGCRATDQGSIPELPWNAMSLIDYITQWT